ncbi:MAG: hypothetical protein GPJ52_01520 [Candidatus Heimdallarchaeota archaeon]|nr:hypothetical protein [Candidatus Heimdallarchaeota archaeon]
MVSDSFQLAMFIISPIILILDAIVITTGIFRKLIRKEKEDVEERDRLFSMVDIMEKIGIGLGILTLILAGFLAVNIPQAGAWLGWFNPITIIFLIIIGCLLALRTLDDTPVTALIAILAGLLGAAVFAAVFGDVGYGKWIYFAVFLAVDIIVFMLVRMLTKQMAMIGRILNWFPVAIIVVFACLGWGIFQIVLLVIHGVNLIILP